jgi:hypothetical protein
MMCALILMLDALRLEVRNLTLQVITANAIRGGASHSLVEEASGKSTAMRNAADMRADEALLRARDA